jgi:acyl transferase domain-containing protein/NAD(P)-dependent dehydrogenase (short-subunit alcohol dehydrogenase family)/acyl carrier protein
LNTAFSPLAIVGIGCLFPKANGPGAYWANVKNGVDAITDVPTGTHWNPDDYFDADPKKPDMTYARRGGFLDVTDFNPLEFGIAPRDIEATDTSQLLGLVAAKQALTDAKVDFATTDRSRVSVILGVTGTLELVIPLGARLGHPHWKRALKEAGVPAEQAADVIERIGESYVPWQENSFPGLLGNVVAGRIANKLDLHGTNCVVDAACASSLSAVHLAAMELQTGKADVVVTGGVDTFNDIFMYMCFSKTPALSPTGNSKPFDANGDGTILGEGLGMVVLKRLADAERDGDTVYAVIKGLGTSSDGKGNAIYAPSAEGQRRCLTDAYTRAAVDPQTVELVEAHGTGTKVGDAVEATGLKAVFGTSSWPRTAVGSVKSMIGHTKAAAGAASLIKAALSLYNKVLPPTLKVNSPVEPLQAADSPFYVNLHMRPWLPSASHPRRAGVSAFGFGGSNFHAVLEEHSPVKAEADWDGLVEILALSGVNSQEVLNALPRGEDERGWVNFARAAEASRQTFNSSAACRLVLVAHRHTTDLPKLLAAVRAKLTAAPNSETWNLPEGAYFGRGTPGKLAVLFPGQGSQRVGMLRDLACTFPEVLGTLADANENRLADVIYPPTSFAPDAKKVHDEALRATDKAQPALGAIGYGAFKVLRDRFKLTADAFAGHSYGELPALTAAGRLSERELHHFSRLRGKLMATRRGGDAGTMLAVLGPLETVEQVICDGRLDVVIANKNSPTQTVLSGSTAAIEAAEPVLRTSGLKGVRIPVAAAFHSPLVADAAVPFRQALEAVAFPAGTQPVYANSTAAEYPSDPTAARELLGNQLAKPVEFVSQIRAMWAAGVRTFVEVGPGRVLAKLVDAILSDANPVFASLDASEGKNPGTLDLAHLLAKLAAAGHAVSLAAWEHGSRCRPAASPAKPNLTVPISGANYVSPRAKKPPRPATAAAAPNTPAAGTRRMTDNPNLTAALQLTQQTLAALQQLQEQTATLHKQFLDQQEQAQRTLFALVTQQQGLMNPTAAPLPTPAPVVPPAPVVAAPPAPVLVRPVAPPAPPPPVMAPVVPPPPPVVAVVPPPVVKNEGIAEVLLGVVSEKTGYPSAMLNLDMALDADLGVDSIKRVEILSALQEKLPAAPVVKPEHLGQLHTLRDVATFLAAGAAVPAAAPLSVSEPPVTSVVSVRMSTAVETLNASLLPTLATVESVLLGVVSEKTGYPSAMLNLDMALDADLGVDSIKRVEILSALQEKLPAAPVVKPEHLGQLHTLRDVAAFLAAGPVSGPVTSRLSPSELIAPQTETIEAISMAAVTESVLAPAVRPEPSPAPRPQTVLPERIDRSILQVVDIDLRLARPRLVLGDAAEVWVVGAADDPLTREVVAQLSAQRLTVKTWGWVDPAVPMAAGNPVGLVLVAPPKAGGLNVNRIAFRWVQHAGPKLRLAAKSGAGLVASVMRFDGGFGLGDCQPTADPTAGGLAGLVKTVRHEWPEVSAKAIDLHPSFATADVKAATAAVVDELLTAGPVEVGVSATHRVAVELARTVRKPGNGQVAFAPTDVVLVTGGGRGVTAEASAALAEAFGCSLVLVGRTPPPAGREPVWAAGLTDEPALKAAAADHLGAAATPKSVAEAVNTVLAQRDIRDTLARIETAGAKAAYLAADVADPEQLADLLDRVQAKYGAVTGVVHGAGVLADRRIEDLTPEQFDAVYRTKVAGLRNLLDLLGGQPLKAVILFTSTTARLGRTGQAAYAVANEVLNKTAQVESRRRPNCRVVALNWGPWEGGMVTPALKKVFENEGVGLIPLDEGGRFAVLELSSPGRSVEVIALGQPPKGAKPQSGILSASGTVRATPAVPAGGSGVTQNGTPAADLAVVFERAVDPTSHPVLRSHVLDGWAIVPMALHLEWLAHAALHGNPGLVFHGFNEARITNGIKVDDLTAAGVRALAGKALKRDGGLFHVPVELRGKRKDGRDVIHSRAEVVLSAALPKAPAPNPLPETGPYPHPLNEIYRYFLFHGPDLHGIERVDGLGEAAVVGTSYPAPTPAEWMASPPRGQWLTDPLVLDVAFQMMILWSFAQHGAGSLPCFAGRYRQFRRSFPAGPCRIAARVTRDNGTYARADIDITDAADGSLVARLEDYECVIDPTLNQAFRRNHLAPRVGV